MAPQPVSRPQPAQQPAAPPRMTLASIRRGRIDSPTRTLLYGVEGSGKSTFGASAPTPIFLGAEDGTGHLDLERFPQPQTWGHVREALRTLRAEEHGYQTLVVDTLDWAEPLLWRSICERDGKKDIEDYGYGKGYVAALDEWRVLINDLELLRAAKAMQIVLLAHSWIKPFKNPEGDDFDRYEMKINPKAAGLLKEWSDTVLFANYETFAHKDDKTKRVRGVSTGARMCYSTRSAAYDAKNRFNLPEQFPLDWQEYEAALRKDQIADPLVIAEECKRKAAELGEETEAKVTELLGQHLGDPAMLARINNKLNARLAERRTANGGA